MGNNYLRKTRNKVKKQPNNRGVRKGIDGKYRVWTLMSAEYLGMIEEDDTFTKDYPVSTTIGCYEGKAEADRALSRPKLEGEWK